jgi:pimeloyl-ACP methyl ester carboxylesterase
VLLIHGFGANTNHWRFNQPVLAELVPTYAIDLLGFGRSDQPRARLKQEPPDPTAVHYGFDLWGQQVADFCREVIDKPVILVGNSIGGVVALRAAQLLGSDACKRVVLIDCAQRLMDDKQLATQPAWMGWIRPLLKTMVSQRWLEHRTLPQCRSPGSDSQRIKTGLSQWQETSTMNWLICCTNPPRETVPQKLFEALSTSSTIT